MCQRRLLGLSSQRPLARARRPRFPSRLRRTARRALRARCLMRSTRPRFARKPLTQGEPRPTRRASLVSPRHARPRLASRTRGDSRGPRCCSECSRSTCSSARAAAGAPACSRPLSHRTRSTRSSGASTSRAARRRPRRHGATSSRPTSSTRATSRRAARAAAQGMRNSPRTGLRATAAAARVVGRGSGGGGPSRLNPPPIGLAQARCPRDLPLVGR